MPDLISILSNASQSLAAAQGAAATASHNLQNVNTPGYSRQRAVIEASLPETTANGQFVGRGSRLAAITQARNRFLESQVHYTFAQESKSKTLSETLAGVHIFDASQPGGVSDSMSALFDNVRRLSGNPTNVALRDGTINAAKALQTSFQRESRNIFTARAAIDQEVQASVMEANDLARNVADLNHKIVMVQMNTGAAPNDLLDLRQKAQDRLAELVGATPIKDAQGRVTLTLPQGGALVAGERASHFETFPDPDNEGHLALRLVDEDGAQLPVANDNLSGVMGGLLIARDDTLQGSATRLDTLAHSLASAFNSAHETALDLDGSPGQALFDTGPTVKGAAAKFTVNSAIANNRSLLATRGVTGGVGDNTGALAMVAIERAAVVGDDSPINAYARLTAEFGASASAANAAYEHDRALKDNLVTRRDQYSGVSVDEELIELTKAQRAYEAVGKVIQTGDQMLKTLLDLK